MNRLKIFFTVLCLGLVFAALTPSAKADEWDKKTVITTTEPTHVGNKVLPPGKYVLRLLDSPSDRHIVQILNEDESKVEATVLATPDFQLTPNANSQFSFWEAPAGQPRGLRSWFHPGDQYGDDFRKPEYPPTQVAAAAPPPPPAPTPEPTPEPTPAPEPQTQAQAQPEPQPQPQETAPAQPEPQPSPQPAPAAPLPKTGSPYPLVGLAGLISLAAAIGVRVVSKRVA